MSTNKKMKLKINKVASTKDENEDKRGETQSDRSAKNCDALVDANYSAIVSI